MAHIYSMTGFGKAVLLLPAKKIIVEVKSLNSKQTDIGIRLPQLYREKESELRQLISETLQRGKIDFNLYCEITGAEKAPQINTELLKEYISQLKAIKEAAGVEGDILGAVMRLPEIMKAAEDEVDADEWKKIRLTALEAINSLMEFRKTEGDQLKEDFHERLAVIRYKMENTADFEDDRMQRIKDKLHRSLNELREKPDENRFEQELIYYLEKLDITEEKVRLKSHLDYFENLLNEGGSIGKKLGFIGQEMGREINTMGSKASHAQMQKLVVEMKDELEKIKEQVLNIL